MLRLLTGRNRALGPALLREVGDALKTEGDALYVVVPKQLTLETELFLLEGLSLQGAFRLRDLLLGSPGKGVKVRQRGKYVYEISHVQIPPSKRVASCLQYVCL